MKPSTGNLHKFVAEEDSCFFDICLPNYTDKSSRKISYYNELMDGIESTCPNKSKAVLEYHTTPPKMPIGFDI